MTLFSQIIRFTLCATLFSLAACQTPSPTQTSVSTKIAQRKFEPYTGPVSLSIDTGMAFQRVGKVVSIANTQSFQIQNLDDADIVFEETFQQDIRKDELYREIDIEDAAHHYTLEVTKNDVKGNAGKVQVNINGTNWIKEKDFSNKENTVTHTSVTLLPKSVLRIRIQGNKDLSVTVRLIAEGSSNTVLRRRGKLERKQVTQAIHDRRNDQNIFDPNDPDSLGQLEPYEGDLVPDDSSAPIVGQVRTNGVDTKIQVGYLTAYVNEPVAANLATLQNRFPVEVVSQQEILGDTMVSLKVRFEDVDLSALVSQWYALNQRTDRFAIPSASFSSSNTAKTIAALASIYTAQDGLLKDIGFANILEKHQVSSAPIVAQEESFPHNDGLWWLKSTHTTEAWNYGLGTNATVAILDSDFGLGVYDYTPDIAKGRILTAPINYSPKRSPGTTITANRYLDFTDLSERSIDCSLKSVPRNPLCTNDIEKSARHGSAVMYMLGADLNNDQGSVGAAPEVKIIPLRVDGEAKSLQFQLQQLLELVESNKIKLDVINISLGYYVSPLGVFFASGKLPITIPVGSEFAINLSEMLALSYLGAESKKTTELIYEFIAKQGVSVVTSAGNDGVANRIEDILSPDKRVNFPSSISATVSVGGYDKNKQRASFPNLPNEITEENYGSSNFSSQITIWAPGRDLRTTVYNQKDLEYISPSGWNPPINSSLEGTSHAAPQVAGVVALMRSANPNLTPWEIRQILQETADAPPDPSSFLVPGETYPVYMLNALKAMQHSKVGAKPAQSYKFKIAYQGGPLASQGYMLDYLRKVPVNGTLPDINRPNQLVKFFGSELSDYPGLVEGDYIEVIGWTNDQQASVPKQRIKVLSLKKIPPAESEYPDIQDLVTLSSTGGSTPSQQSPFRFNGIAFPLETNYIKVTLNGGTSTAGQKLYLRHKDLDADSQAFATLSATPDEHNAQSNKVALGTEFTEVGTLSGSQSVIIAVQNGASVSDYYEIEMALEEGDTSRVRVQTSASFSMGGMDPVQVVLNIKDENGQPANGSVFVRLDRNAGTFKSLAPTLSGGNIESSGMALPVRDGYLLLEYYPFLATRDKAIAECGSTDTPCKAMSARFEVSLCDYFYYGIKNCPIIGPGEPGPDNNQGRIYTTWINGWGEAMRADIKAGSPAFEVNFSGLTDSAGRVVPDGYEVFLNPPYWGSISLLDGFNTTPRLPIKVQNGGLRFLYKPVGLPTECWPDGNPLGDGVSFGDSYYGSSLRAQVLNVEYTSRCQ